MDKDRAFRIMQESLDGLARSGLISNPLILSQDSVLLGTGSNLDSIGFVTFVADVEDRLLRETGRESYLVLDQISDFSIDNPFLNAEGFANYMVRVCQ